jgi:lon-related putative ATP-dependent protease
MALEPLTPASLYRHTEPSRFRFTSTRDLEPLDAPPGQQRPMDALSLGAAIRQEGFNIFALGPPGLGKQHAVRTMLERRAAQEPPGDDWCYVNTFDTPQRPRCLRLPPGRALELKRGVDGFIDAVSTRLPAAFQSDDYRLRVKALEKTHDEARDQALTRARDQVEALGLALVRSPTGIALIPTKDGALLEPEQFEALPAPDKARYQAELEKARAVMEAFGEALPQLEHEHQRRLRELNRGLAASTVSKLAAELRDAWDALGPVLDYLKAVERDVVEHSADFLGDDERPDGGLAAMLRGERHEARELDRYQVNVLVTRQPGQGAPVVVEERPGVGHLVGRVEHRQVFGALLTDFTLIRRGALHEANGGYLLLDALKVLQHPYAWEELKRALRSRAVEIEPLSAVLGLTSDPTLEPEPMPLDVKVVLLGDRRLYDALSTLDPDFPELFKVTADFAEDLPRTDDNEVAYARLLGQLARANALKPLDPGAVARVIEFGARYAGDAEKVTTHTRVVADVLREADHWATVDGHDLIGARDVQRALDARERRGDRLRERVQEAIRRGTLLVATRGEVVGQVNGLAVARVGELDFGHPVRITAQARLGKGEVLDIEREATLGGPLHSKGVLIITGLLGARYTHDRPFSLSASVVFEQSYGPVEGDSASAAELFALLSTLAGVPLTQRLAVTGSVDQHGRVQPIGGVNEKVEGFFEVCRQAGLTGDQGVVIPRANVKHLMLSRDVVEAVAAGRFRVWAIETVDEGLALLTGLEAGERGADGRFPAASVNGKVAARLAALADQARAFTRGAR